jgi:hypothetical protein
MRRIGRESGTAGHKDRMRSSKTILVCILAVTLSSCQSNRGNGYADLMDHPLPTTDAERDSQCAWIRSEVARQQSIAQYGTATATSPMMAVAIQSAARRNIANLQSRSSQIQCDVVRVAPTQPVVAPAQPTAPAMNFDQCFAKCRELTTRTEAECFDSCRH